MNGWVEQGIEQGLEQGLEQGRQEGLELGQRQERVRMVCDLLNFKVNGLRSEVIAQVQALPDDKLGELARALFEFTTPADVENWLKQHA